MTALVLVSAVLCQADPLPPETGWHKHFQAVAEEYVVETSGAKPVACKLKPPPVLRWNQPVRGGDDGAVYVWLRGGRPAVIGTIFAWPLPDGRRNVVHELHSLDTVPLSVDWQGRVRWTPDKAGVTFASIPEAPVPAKSAPQRLVQMRALARKFSARSIDGNEKDWELRLLPAPLYRYEIEEPKDALDGGIFVMAQGTDPEILLLIEARQENGTWTWQYAAGRFSDRKLRLKLGDEEVWSVDRSTFEDRKGAYFVMNAETRELPGEAAEEKPIGKRLAE